jgi:hypothetical protein
MAGADVRQGEQVRRIEVAENRVVVETKPGTTVVARYVIDASGPRAFLGRRNRTIEPIPGVGRAAAWVHYDGLRPDTAAELAETGNIIIVYLEDGWGWLIPLPDRQLSAGVVSRDQGLDADVYEASLGRLSLVRRLTEGSTRSDPALVGNFSFRNTAPFGSRYACVGDAAGFLDPVFSTGVSLAMASAERIAATLGAALQGGTEAESALMDPVAAWLEVGYERFLGLIRLFYETRLLRRLVFHDDPDPTLRAGLISMLAGEVWSDDNPFWVKMGRHAARTLDERRAKAGE